MLPKSCKTTQNFDGEFSFVGGKSRCNYHVEVYEPISDHRFPASRACLSLAHYKKRELPASKTLMGGCWVLQCYSGEFWDHYVLARESLQV